MFTGLSARNLSLYPRGGSFPRFRGFIRGKSFLVPARQLFSTLPRVYPREFFPCTRAMALFRASAGLFARFLSLYPRGGSFPRFRGFIRGKSFPVPARWLFSAFPRVYPREIFPCTRAVALFRASAGLFAGFLSLYPRGGSFPRFRGFIRAFSSPVPARWLFSALQRVYSRVFFPCTRAATLYITSANSAFAAFFKSSGFRVSWTPILPPLTTILSRDAAPASIRVTYCFFMPMAVQPPRT